MKRIQVLVSISAYLPGFKAGGPIRSVSSLVERLSDEFEFSILTADRDLGDSEPYDGVESDRWVRVGPARVFYCSPESQRLSRLLSIVRETDHHLLYLNSFFHPVFSAPFTWMALRHATIMKPLLIAPRGELASGALRVRRWKKEPFLAFARFAGLPGKVTWQASSPREKADLRRRFGPEARVRIAGNLGGQHSMPLDWCDRAAKRSGHLRIAYLGRVAKNKNLLAALHLLRPIGGHIVFDIYGPIEDEAYGRECRAVAASLPENVRVSFMGPIAPSATLQTLARYDLMFLPTLGENYGHAIRESLIAGTPVLISDRTPWRSLHEGGAGWDVSLSKPDEFVSILRRCVAMEDEEHRSWRTGARRAGLAAQQDEEDERSNRDLLRMTALRMGSANRESRGD